MAGAANADELVLVPEKSVFAVVVHKAGPAARLAHNHWIQATEFTSNVNVEGEELESVSFELSVPASKLKADDPDAAAKWFRRLHEIGILDTPFTPLSESDRATVTRHMLAENQLDAGAFPTVSAKLMRLEPSNSAHGNVAFQWKALVAFTVHGETVERDFAANVEVRDGAYTVEAAASFTFSEFDIKPYSALLGAVRNRDEFDVYANFRVRRQSTKE
jgi:hypothetical protein